MTVDSGRRMAVWGTHGARDAVKCCRPVTSHGGLRQRVIRCRASFPLVGRSGLLVPLQLTDLVAVRFIRGGSGRGSRLRTARLHPAAGARSRSSRLWHAAGFTRHAGAESLTLVTTSAFTAQIAPATAAALAAALADRLARNRQLSLPAIRHRRPAPTSQRHDDTQHKADQQGHSEPCDSNRGHMRMVATSANEPGPDELPACPTRAQSSGQHRSAVAPDAAPTSPLRPSRSVSLLLIR